MSLLSRTQYLASLANEVTAKITPLIEQHAQIIQTKEEIITELNKQVEELNSAIELAILKGNSFLESKILKHRDELIASINEEVNKSVDSMLTSVETTANSIIRETDGVSGTVDISLTSFSIDIQPDLLNRTTDFVDNTITDPNTVVNINTVVTGTAGGYPIVNGSGTQVANITTD